MDAYLEVLKKVEAKIVIKRNNNGISKGVLVISILLWTTHETTHSPNKIKAVITNSINFGMSKESVVKLENIKGVKPATTIRIKVIKLFKKLYAWLFIHQFFMQWIW